MQKETKQTKKRKFWHKQVKRWERSGKKISDFCRQAKISAHDFHYWRKIVLTKGTKQFVPVINPFSSGAMNNLPYEIVLADGMKVRLSNNFNPVILRNLIQTLRETYNDTH